MKTPYESPFCCCMEVQCTAMLAVSAHTDATNPFSGETILDW